MLPIFFFGVILADMETIPTGRPLDRIRNLDIKWKVPINILLFTIFIVYGSYFANDICEDQRKKHGTCGLWVYLSKEKVQETVG